MYYMTYESAQRLSQKALRFLQLNDTLLTQTPRRIQKVSPTKSIAIQSWRIYFLDPPRGLGKSRSWGLGTSERKEVLQHQLKDNNRQKLGGIISNLLYKLNMVYGP